MLAGAVCRSTVRRLAAGWYADGFGDDYRDTGILLEPFISMDAEGITPPEDCTNKRLVPFFKGVFISTPFFDVRNQKSHSN